MRRLLPYPITSLILCLSMTITGCSDSKNYTQPILYNHNKHIEEVGLNCFDCHPNVLANEKASIPNIDVCKKCHEQPITESKEEKKLVEFIKKNQTIPWIQVHRIPDHVYFSHRRHVTIGKIACLKCHGNVTEMKLPFSKPYAPIKMSFCVRCHAQNNVDTDCSTCHR